MFGKLGRMVRHLEATGVGLVPDHGVVVDEPDARAVEALAAARRGAYAPARVLLAATREEADWTLRDEAATALAEIAVDDGAWLGAWLGESPEDPDALLVEAFRRIREAWEVRTAAYAKDVDEERFRAFHALLDDALPVIETAIAAAPGDPVPWSAALAHCIGAGAPRDVFDGCLGRALACAPHHLPTHLNAVQYLTAKWYGSNEETLDYAARAAADAPKGSALGALETVALAEVGFELERTDERPRGGRTAPAPDRVDAVIATAQAYSASRPPEDREARLIRNHLVCVLDHEERWAESLDVYRSIGRGATSAPWADPANALEVFLSHRDKARAWLAAAIPRNGTVPAPAVPLPESAQPQAAREIAYVPATPQRASQELLLCGATVRLAPAGRWTLMEAAPSQETPGKRGRRVTVLRLDGLANVAETAFDSDGLTTLVAQCEGAGSRGLTVVTKGRTTARHRWAGPGTVPSQETAQRHAELLVAAAGGDAREVARMLRDPGDPSELLIRALNALGLPPLPAGFGERSEVLADARGATVHRARSLWQGMKDFMSDDTDPNPPLQLDGR